MLDTVRHKIANGVATLSLDPPEILNALSGTELLLLGEEIPAAEVERIGIVNRVGPMGKSPVLMRPGEDAFFEKREPTWTGR